MSSKDKRKLTEKQLEKIAGGRPFRGYPSGSYHWSSTGGRIFPHSSSSSSSPLRSSTSGSGSSIAWKW